MKTLIIKTVMSFLLITVFTQAVSQNTNSFLKDYYKLGAFGQYTVDSKGIVYKEDPTVGYNLLEYKSYQFGLLYNIYQEKKWNFKTGFILKFKSTKERMSFKKEQTGYNRDISYTISTYSASRMYSVPLITEYIIPLNNRIKWEVAPSLTFSYYTGQKGDSGNFRGSAKIYKFYDGYKKKPFFVSAEISTGFYILFKHFMLQPEFRYSKSFRPILTGYYETEGFLTEPHSSKGTFEQSGDYWGFSLSVYIKNKNDENK